MNHGYSRLNLKVLESSLLDSSTFVFFLMLIFRKIQSTILWKIPGRQNRRDFRHTTRLLCLGQAFGGSEGRLVQERPAIIH